jgi:hypothetical protein
LSYVGLAHTGRQSLMHLDIYKFGRLSRIFTYVQTVSYAGNHSSCDLELRRKPIALAKKYVHIGFFWLRDANKWLVWALFSRNRKLLYFLITMYIAQIVFMVIPASPHAVELYTDALCNTYVLPGPHFGIG